MKKLFVYLVLSAVICPVAEAQLKNSLLDPAAFEPSIAISKDNPEIIVASSSPDNIYHSANGGMSWEKVKLTSVYGVSGNLVLYSDFKGNFYCLHRALINNKSQIVMQQSSNGGKTWSEGALVSTDTSRYAINPRAAIDRKGNLFVTWTDFDIYKSDNQNCMSRILLSRSSNGKKWSKPVELSQTPGNCNDGDDTPAGATPAVMGGGQRAFAAWANGHKIFFDRAFDGGDTWLMNDLAIAEQAGGWSMQIPGVQNANGMPVLLCNNTRQTDLTGALLMVWADQLRGENDTDIWFTRSLNFGDNWVQPERVNNDTPGKHQYLPSMTFDASTGNIYIVYYDRRNYVNETTDVYIAFSKDGGASFKNVKISDAPFVADGAVTTGNFIGISAHDGTIAATWTRTENGTASVWLSVMKQEELEKLVKP
ncbi:MAG: sialidase family protein [Cyclobacteriaceae bacterium]